MKIKKTYEISVGNLTKKEAKKLIKLLIDEYKYNEYSILEEMKKKELLKNRLDKLNKIYGKDTN